MTDASHGNEEAELVDSHEPLQLAPGGWYGWLMLPGYGSTPYFSPIRIDSVTPIKTRRKVLEVCFFNAFYAQGVQDFTVNLRTFKHTSEYLVADLEGDPSHPRSAVITSISFEWIRHFAPNAWESSQGDTAVEYATGFSAVPVTFNRRSHG